MLSKKKFQFLVVIGNFFYEIKLIYDKKKFGYNNVNVMIKFLVVSI